MGKAKKRSTKSGRTFRPYNVTWVPPPRPPPPPPARNPPPVVPVVAPRESSFPSSSSCRDMVAVYVLIATHHVPHHQDILGGPPDDGIVMGCACSTTVCGVFTSLELAQLAKADQCRRFLGYNKRTTNSNKDERRIHCRRDGSYSTSFQIAEREIWAFPHAQQPIGWNRHPAQPPKPPCSWMTGHPPHPAPVDDKATTTDTKSITNSVTLLAPPPSVTPLVPSNTPDHGDSVGIDNSKQDDSGFHEEEEKKEEE